MRETKRKEGGGAGKGKRKGKGTGRKGNREEREQGGNTGSNYERLGPIMVLGL